MLLKPKDQKLPKESEKKFIRNPNKKGVCLFAYLYVSNSL